MNMKWMHYLTKAIGLYAAFSGKLARAMVFLSLAVMLFFLVSVSGKESAVMDELAHIPAGYSYLTKQDRRLNPERPPLLKDLSALPLIFMDLDFPTGIKAWTADVNGQWVMGDEFLYKSGNDPDRIIFWSRMGSILLTVLLGFFIFKFGTEFFSGKVGLLALILFAFSPAVLAHGKYVTTDVAAAFGFFTATFYFLRYLKEPTRKNLVWAGVFFGIAQALKFSLVLLIPFFIGIALLWALSHHDRRMVWRWMGRVFVIFAIGYIGIIWPLYQFHVWNYPAGVTDPAHIQEIAAVTQRYCPELNKDRVGPSQYRDTACNLKTFRPHALADAIVWMSDKPVLRPLAQYAHGVLMVGQRTAGGNTTYFLGDVSIRAWWYYFPVVYLIKEPLAGHVLSLAALVILCAYLGKKRILSALRKRHGETLRRLLREHFAAATAILLVLYYWGVSMLGNLNIGVRHIIPTLPFIFLLVADIILTYLGRRPSFELNLSLDTVKRIASFYFVKAWHYAALCVIVLWYVISTIAHYPYFTSYFNELIGGSKNGHRYVADSNLDWGQDMKRLAQFTKDNNINKIRVAYFGAGSPDYYLKDKYIPWWSSRGAEPGWYAISATFLDEAFGLPVGKYVRAEQDSYPWLRGKTPVTVIGNSIFVYRLE